MFVMDAPNLEVKCNKCGEVESFPAWKLNEEITAALSSLNKFALSYFPNIYPESETHVLVTCRKCFHSTKIEY